MAAVLSDSRRQVSITTLVTTWPLLLLAALPVVGWLLGGGVWHWLTVAFFAVMVVIDPLIGPDKVNAPPEAEAQLERRLYYRVMLWLVLPAAYAVNIFCVYLITQTGLSAFEIVGLALSMALAAGFPATAAHELAHHPSKIDRFIGILLFAPINMCDFAIYHNYGHHNRVATPEDPGSAKYGENMWSFAFRSIVLKTVMGWEIEAERLRRQGRPWWNWRNRMIWMQSLPFMWLAVLVYFFGWGAVPLFLLLFAFGRGLLAVADFVEHYGLGRRRLPDGSWEPCKATHAWDDSFIVSSLFFCQIDRHSDHHANVGRPYQILRVMDDAPRLPFGYLTMLGVAMIPPLWRKMMHPRLHAHYEAGRAVPHGRPENLPDRFVADAVY